MATRVNLDALNHGNRLPEAQLDGDEVALLNTVTEMYLVLEKLPLEVIVTSLADLGFELHAADVSAAMATTLRESFGLEEEDGYWQ